jgi:hypothetical protein
VSISSASAQRRPWLYDEMGRKRSPPLVDERTCCDSVQPCEEIAPGLCECVDPSDADRIYVQPLTWIRRPAPTQTLTGGGGIAVVPRRRARQMRLVALAD